MAEEEGGEDDVHERAGSFFAENRRAVIAAAVAVVLILVLAVSGSNQPSVQGEDSSQTDQNAGSFDHYASGGEETGSTDVSGAMEFTTVVIGQNGVDPSRPSLDVGDAVRWENRLGFPLELSFDRVSENVTIPANGEGSMRFRGVTYYRVYNVDTGERVARGSVSVS